MKKRNIAIIGLGYAGLHTALAFGRKNRVIGYDINKTRVQQLASQLDTHGDFTAEDFSNNLAEFTADPERLQAADFYIIIVPTPINVAKEPDFSDLISASTLVGKYLTPGDIVVFESTVYPGTTEEICLAVLEQESGLKSGKDFFLGYSPERINPGDKIHKFEEMVKIVSSNDKATLNIIIREYGEAVSAGVYPVSSIKVAEAAKVIENTQRDVNIAFMNEIAMLLHKFDLNTVEVLNAALTKWNFLPFKPGFVGGHCISVDPYYLLHKAQALNYSPDIIPAARKVNEHVPAFIAEETIKFMIKHHSVSKDNVIGILGITYKENCPDIRNSLVVHLVQELESYQVKVKVYDPVADKAQVKREYDIVPIENWDDFSDLSAILIAVAHDEFKQISIDEYRKKLVKDGVIIDVKGILPAEKFKSVSIDVWQF